jgi:predicted dehydrogenase/threonine dehydrogenase-like Zn-dependent dehydrogenase
MLQAIVKKGRVIAEEIPVPKVSEGTVLIKVVNSCISTGTEIHGIKRSKRSLVQKAIEKPDKILNLLKKLKTNGVASVSTKIKGAMICGTHIGYSVSGVIVDVGKDVDKFKVGDFVAAAGGGFAVHAEYVVVPKNLVVKIPKEVNFLEAATVTLGAIAMQGVRRADLKIGEFGVVFGAGLVGQLSIQLLRANGVRIAAIDLNNKRLDMAKDLGAELTINPYEENCLNKVENWTGGYGADAVLFTAATQDNEPLSLSFQMCRKKGHLVLVGVSGMLIKREDMYSKELDLKISTSYGPGRYDPEYEEKGLDYPYAYVRWTENRNMSEYLRLVNSGSIKLDDLTSAIYPIKKVTEAYECLKDTINRPLMVIIDYGKPESNDIEKYQKLEKRIVLNTYKSVKNIINVAVVGAGGFATGVHLPNLKRLHGQFHIYAIMDKVGLKSKNVAKQFGANYATTDYDEILNDKNVDLIMITTRHDSHADLTLKALQAGKNVFVEKPLATNQEELKNIKEFFNSKLKTQNSNLPILMVGFNRRFSPYAREIKKHTEKRINPLFIHYRMNAGFIPLNHWIHDNGGRIVGEACHIIDLMAFFTGSHISSISFESLYPKNDKFSKHDNKSIILSYKDGSICTIEYFAVGNKQLSKESMEIHFDGNTILMDSYKNLKGLGIKINEIKTHSSQKGHFEELKSLYESLSGKREIWPIELWDIIQTTESTFMIGE